MNIWIYTHLDQSPSVDLLIEAARARKHRAAVVRPGNLVPVVGPSGELEILFPRAFGGELPDVVITRTGSSAPLEALSTIQHFERCGVPVVNGWTSLMLCRDKFRSAQALAAERLAQPRTALITGRRPEELRKAAAAVGRAPWVLKSVYSFKGQGVHLVDDAGTLQRTVDELHPQGSPLILQENVAESRGKDTRVIVLDGRAVAAMDRFAKAGEFRANLHQGGTAEARALTPELAGLAQRATRVMQLDAAGVDLIESSRGMLILEVNGSPGLEGIGKATGIPLADRYLQLAERRKESADRALRRS